MVDFNNNKDLEKIHEASMKIIEMNGFKFNSPEVLEMLKEKGVKVSGNLAYFEPKQVMEWVKKAPSSFTMYGRDEKYNIVIGDDHVECAPGFGCPFIRELDGTLRPGVVDDYIEFAKLFHQSEHFNINGGVLVQPSDVNQEKALSIMLYSTLLHSDKCLLSGSGNRADMETQMELLSIVFGGKDELIKKPRMATVININSPMQYDTTQLDSMMVCINNGQPVGINGGIMAGTSGPVSMASAIALGNAEVLVGIAVAQMIKEGAPVMYGLPAAQGTDMRTASTAIGGPETSIGTTYGARLAKAYGLPTRGCGAPTDGKSALSVQSGYEAMMLFMANYMAKVNMIVHSAGVMDSYLSMSRELFIVNLEIIGMVKHFLDGLTIDENSFALDLIQKVGAGGHYLNEPETFMNFRKEIFTPAVSLRGNVDGDPNAALIERINQKKNAMLEAYEQPYLPKDIQAELAKTLEAKGISSTILNKIG